MPLCHSPEERLFFQQTILHRLVANPPFHSRDTYSSKRLINECLERLRYEGNAHLLNMEELPQVLQEFMDEDKLLERSQMRRATNQIRRGSRLARFIYPKSRWRRVTYQARYILRKLRQRVARWFRF
jgi:hypothetical protein